MLSVNLSLLKPKAPRQIKGLASSTFSNDFSCGALRTIIAEFYIYLSVVRELTFCASSSGPFTQMAVLPICGKNPLNSLILRNKKKNGTLKLGLMHFGLKSYQIYSKHDPFWNVDLDHGKVLLASLNVHKEKHFQAKET